MKSCTWEGCTASGGNPLVSRDHGDVYADLCVPHMAEFDKTVRTVGMQRDPRLLAVWVKAQGGQAAALRRQALRALRTEGKST